VDPGAGLHSLEKRKISCRSRRTTSSLDRQRYHGQAHTFLRFTSVCCMSQSSYYLGIRPSKIVLHIWSYEHSNLRFFPSLLLLLSSLGPSRFRNTHFETKAAGCIVLYVTLHNMHLLQRNFIISHTAGTVECVLPIVGYDWLFSIFAAALHNLSL
jgi:hypothetical protein